MRVSIRNAMHSLPIALLVSCCASAAAADVVVVVSAKNPVSVMHQAEVANIFLGKLSLFPGGGEAIPVDIADREALREEFYYKITGKTPSLLRAYWSKLIFTGNGQPPKEMRNDSVRKLVSSNEKYIGYMDSTEVDANVKVVLHIR